MKIILTGGSGFLGQAIRKSFKDAEFITVGRRESSIVADLSIESPSLPYSDLVIHAAGKAHVFPKNDIERQEFHTVNVEGTVRLLKALENVGTFPKAFVFISTVAVYGLESGRLINEECPLNALDPYGKSKIEAENIVQAWCADFGVKCAILRLPLIAGPNPPGNLGSMIKGIKNGYYFNISGGNARKSVVMAQDVANIIPKAAETGGVFNLTDRCHPSFSELAKIIGVQLGRSHILDIPAWMAFFAAKIGDLFGEQVPLTTRKLSKITNDLTFDDSKAVSILKWNPGRVLDNFKIN